MAVIVWCMYLKSCVAGTVNPNAGPPWWTIYVAIPATAAIGALFRQFDKNE
jgi:hypothetical protein